MRRIEKQERFGLRFGFATCAVMTVVMLGLAYHGFVTRPAAYEALRERGAPATARVHCDADGDDCALTYVHGGRTRRNDYRTDTRQFSGARTVEVLVDPRHPSTMYTVRDVRRGGKAGGGVFALLAAAFGVATFLSGRSLRHFVPGSELRPEPPAGLSESRRLALEAIDATEEVLCEGSLRHDPQRLAEAVAYLRERLAALPGREQLARGLGEEIERQLGEAKPVPLLGGVRLDPDPLHRRLDELRLRVVAAAR